LGIEDFNHWIHRRAEPPGIDIDFESCAFGGVKAEPTFLIFLQDDALRASGRLKIGDCSVFAIVNYRKVARTFGKSDTAESRLGVGRAKSVPFREHANLSSGASDNLNFCENSPVASLKNVNVTVSLVFPPSGKTEDGRGKEPM